MTAYVCLGVAKNDNASLVDIDAIDSGREPGRYARRRFAEYVGFERVEICCDDERVGVAARPAQGHAS